MFAQKTLALCCSQLTDSIGVRFAVMAAHKQLFLEVLAGLFLAMRSLGSLLTPL